MRNRIFLVSILIMFFLLAGITSQSYATWMSVDIGSPSIPGSSTGTPPGSIIISGDGADIWGSSDSFHFAYDNVLVSGDFTAIVRLLNQTDTNGWAKAGIMARADLTENSVHVSTFGTIDNGIINQWRDSTGAGSNWYSFSASPNSNEMPYWLYLERSGNEFISKWAFDGSGTPNSWSVEYSHSSTNMPNDIYLGLAVTSHTSASLSIAEFDNFTVNPIPEPTTILLFGFGILGLTGLSRRKK